MTRVTTRAAASEPAAIAEHRGGKADEQIFERVGAKQAARVAPNVFSTTAS